MKGWRKSRLGRSHFSVEHPASGDHHIDDDYVVDHHNDYHHVDNDNIGDGHVDDQHVVDAYCTYFAHQFNLSKMMMMIYSPYDWLSLSLLSTNSYLLRLQHLTSVTFPSCLKTKESQ